MKVLFLDESGDHNLEVIDPLYPLFVLGGGILEKEYAEGDLVERLDAFKRKLFGRTDLVLHTADITRNKNGFERLKDTAFRTEFYLQLNLFWFSGKWKKGRDELLSGRVVVGGCFFGFAWPWRGFGHGWQRWPFLCREVCPGG